MKAILFILAVTGFLHAQTTRVACVGNSITAGATIANAADFYPAKLQGLLGASYSVANFGYSGATMQKGTSNPYWDCAQFTQARVFNSDIVILMLGTNDSKVDRWNRTQFLVDATKMVDTLKAPLKNTLFFICLPPKIFNEASYGHIDSILYNHTIPALQQIATLKNGIIIDLYTPFAGREDLYNDGLHPSAAGADTLAHIVYRAILDQISKIDDNGPSMAKIGPGIEILPNPFNATVTLSFGHLGQGRNMETIRIYDMQGRLVQDVSGRNLSTFTWSAGSQPSGLYIVAVYDGKKTTFQRINLIR